MQTTDQYKLLRRGGVRTGAGMSRSGRRSANLDALAPNIEEFGLHSFTMKDLQTLALRLQDASWPRETLNIYGLEGLLTALLVLSVELRPGAWLPLIWKETGWKIPVALQGADQFREFIELIVGFMRTIDAGLSETPHRFASVLDILPVGSRPKTSHPDQDWARGFGLAINQSTFLKIQPDSITHRTLYVIANHTTAPATNTPKRGPAAPTLQQAVAALATVRTSRGPLGALPPNRK